MFWNFTKSSLTLTFGIVIALSVGSCSSAQSLPFFEHDQKQSDILPSIVTATDIDKASSRHLGQGKNGTDYFAAQTISQDSSSLMFCLVVVGPDGDWSRGCSEKLPLKVGLSSLKKEATLNPVPRPDSQECLGDHECVGDYVDVQPLSP